MNKFVMRDLDRDMAGEVRTGNEDQSSDMTSNTSVRIFRNWKPANCPDTAFGEMSPWPPEANARVVDRDCIGTGHNEPESQRTFFVCYTVQSDVECPSLVVRPNRGTHSIGERQSLCASAAEDISEFSLPLSFWPSP